MEILLRDEAEIIHARLTLGVDFKNSDMQPAHNTMSKYRLNNSVLQSIANRNGWDRPLFKDVFITKNENTVLCFFLNMKTKKGNR